MGYTDMPGMDINKLDSGMFSDVLDCLGYRHQIIPGFLRNHRGIKCLGRARTLELEAMETDDERIKMGLTFLGTILPGEILLVKGSDQFAYFGEMMTKLSTRQGIGGVVIDGLTRDTNYTHQDFVQLPILARGYSPVDIKGRGRVKATDVAIEIDSVLIHTGDLIFVDNEAICVVPKEIEILAIESIQQKVAEEARITELIQGNIGIEEMLKIVKEF